MQSFYPSYWASFEPDELLAHARLFAEFDKTGQPLCLDLRPDAASRTTVLTIIAQDHPGLFSRIAGAVAMAGCSIVSARINTRLDGTILDVFRLQDSQLQAPADPAQLGRLQELVREALAGRFLLTDRLRQKTEALPRAVKAMKLAPRVIVTNKMSKTHTVIEVNGNDRPGLLYDITGALVHLGLQINSASVSTYGEKAVDVFYVKDLFGLKLASETRMEQIRVRLTDVLAAGGPKKAGGEHG
jgi:[protein-PII] uridylyltransferase